MRQHHSIIISIFNAVKQHTTAAARHPPRETHQSINPKNGLSYFLSFSLCCMYVCSNIINYALLSLLNM